MIELSYFIFIVLFLEIFLYLLIYSLKKNFQWLITKKDDLPVFKNKKTERFFKNHLIKILDGYKSHLLKIFMIKQKKEQSFLLISLVQEHLVITTLKKK